MSPNPAVPRRLALPPDRLPVLWRLAGLLSWVLLGLLSACTCGERGQAKDVQAERYVVVSVGDINLAEDVSPLLEEHGGNYSFEHLRAHMKGDQLLGNLETVATELVLDPRLKKSSIHRMEPKFLPTLREEGFTVLSLANNHAFDQGAEGLLSQIEHMKRLEMKWVGGGHNLAEAQRAEIFEGGGLKIAVIGMYQVNKRYKALGFYAESKKPGIWGLRGGQVAAVVKRLREKQGVDYVIASVHWGPNYKPEIDYQKKLARKLVRAGVDLVNGHGGHMTQGVELVDGVPVLYGLGNFTFGSKGIYKRKSPNNRTSAIARYIFENGRLGSIELLPIRTDNRRVKYKPLPADRDQAEAQFEPVIGRYGLPWERREDGWYVWRPSGS